MVSNTVVTQLKQKDGNNFVITPIGPELKYVGAQQNSNTHNLEEQLIIGVDKQTVITDAIPTGESYLQRTEQIKFKTSSATDNYYILNKTIQMELATSFNENNHKLILNLNPKILSENEALTFYVNSGTTVTSTNKTGTYSYNNNVTTITENITESV